MSEMASSADNETGFSESDLHFARQTFYRDCPNGSCSKQKFFAFLQKSFGQTSSHKPARTNPLFQPFLSRQHYRQSKKFFSMMFDIYDRNQDGQLDFSEYVYALSALTGANRLRTIETLYRFFDIHQQGFITRQEFNARKKLAAQFLGQYKTGINESLSYEQAFNAMDVDQDGRISKEEFIQWHLQDHAIADETKPTKRRIRILKNLSSLVDMRGQIKTSSLQQSDNNPNTNKNSINAWLETTMNVNGNTSTSFDLSSIPSSPLPMNADRYLLKVLRRARNRFIEHRQSSRIRNVHVKPLSIDNYSDSGVFTTSSRTNFNEDFESNSLLDTDEDYREPIDKDDPDSELLCQSLEAALMETLLELRQWRSNSYNLSSPKTDNDQEIITRL